MGLIQVKREATFIDYRNKLVEAGLIEYQKGKKGSPNRYKLISLSEVKNNNTFTSEVQTVVNTEVQTVVNTEVQSVVNTEVNPEVNPVVKTVDINKLKHKHKLKQKSIPPIVPHEGDAPESVPRETVQYKKIADYWNSVCTELPKVQALNDNRKKAVRARVKEHGEETVLRVIALVKQSDFLCGRTGNNWNASFDWVMKPANFVKVLEGNYANKSPAPPNPPGTARSLDDLTDNPFLKIAMEEEMKNE
ncbi:hypothetical protein [Eubacterium callanderi]|nr:hypothetical protein [Eubacterium callanderi]MCG4588704.1 hypothetical protein [Eubacterium callanderi]MCQ4824315.1 hypothetical protein [Eubacterium callanderi]